MNYKKKLNHIKAFIFDCDGVLTDGSITLMRNGEQVRKMSTRDGYALQLAVKKGYIVALITGGSYGAGNYAMSGRSYESRFVYAWPSSKIAVMGGDQAAKTLLQINLSKKGAIDKEMKDEMYNKIKSRYDNQSNIKYAAARLWVDEVIDPRDTRKIFIRSLEIINNQEKCPSPRFGVIQV